jgi:hypothetical protein
MYDRINESLATIRRFRPAWADRYSLEAPWAESQVAAFESRHRCRLPDEYRGFILHVGAAGAGPDYGLFAPDQHFSGSGYEDCLCDDPDLGIPFPHSGAWNECPPREMESDDDYFSSRHSSGSLIIGDRGCALWTRLIVTGPCAGQIWHEDRAEGLGLRPLLTSIGSRLTFLSWYIDWLDTEVYQYGHAGNPR